MRNDATPAAWTGARSGTLKGTGTAAARATIALSLLFVRAHKLSFGRRGARMSDAWGLGASLRTSLSSLKFRGTGAPGVDVTAARATTGLVLFLTGSGRLLFGKGATATAGDGADVTTGGAPNNSRADTVRPWLTAGKATEATALPAKHAETSAKTQK